MVPTSNDWLTCEEVARLEGLAVRSVQNRCAQGKLPCKKFGKNWLINRLEYEKTIKRRLAQTSIPDTANLTPGGKRIVFANHKGGVGKTTTLLIVADKFSQLGFSVLVVDLDPQGNATTWAGLRGVRPGTKPGKGEFDKAVHDVLNAEIMRIMGQEPTVSIEDAIYRARHFEIIPSDHRLEKMYTWPMENALVFTDPNEIYTVWTQHFPRLLQYALSRLQKTYDLILIDTPPGLGFFTGNAMVAGTHVIIPTELGRFEIQGLTRVFGFIDECKLYNPWLSVLGILISRFFSAGGTKSNLDRDLEDLLRSNTTWGHLVYNTVIQRSLLVREATAKAQSVFEYWRQGLPTRSRESIENFCEELAVQLLSGDQTLKEGAADA